MLIRKESFYRSFNDIFGRVGRLANEEVVLVWFRITLTIFRTRITTIRLYLSKLYLKHYWFHFFLDTVYFLCICFLCYFSVNKVEYRTARILQSFTVCTCTGLKMMNIKKWQKLLSFCSVSGMTLLMLFSIGYHSRSNRVEEERVLPTPRPTVCIQFF